MHAIPRSTQDMSVGYCQTKPRCPAGMKPSGLPASVQGIHAKLLPVDDLREHTLRPKLKICDVKQESAAQIGPRRCWLD